MKILFNYPSRSRPELFKRGVDSIVCNSDSKHDILAIVDANDIRLREYDFTLVDHVNNGISASKVDAINRGCKFFMDGDYDVLVNMSDDMVFIHQGFDRIIANYFSDSTDKLLLFPDGNRHDLVTMSIIGREYFMRDKYIYNHEYKSLWCDNEATEVAKKRGCLVVCNENIFVHLHPAYGKAQFDAQYQHTEAFSNEDQQTYLKRKAINFEL